uniref:Integrase catalytic domain-containing protein n=1 Tax=Meloidogyne hapla TaxID=6305 RepID=A0A1I8BIN4_MELHA
MNNFWSLETIGVKDDPTSKDDQVAMDFFKQTIKRSPNGRYIVKWPWKENKENLPSNFSLAYRRFLGLMERLKKNPDLMLEYEKIIESDIKRGVLEDADRNKGSIEHFLPHHPVITTKKVRIVYDASAKIRGGKSLNELLYRGPIIMPELAGMLIRFRLPEIAIWADIEKAFHCLELDPEDREVLKLIWLKDVRKPISSENIKYLRFSKVPFGVISSPFLLSATVRHHLESMDDPIAKMVKNNSYVDNILIGVDTKEEAYEAYIKLKSIFKTAQMNLREKFVENRIKEIRSHEDLKFGYTPTECNPADIATRGCAPVELSTNYLWWTGPEWLTNDSWPVELNFVVENKEENNPEEKFNFEVNQINNKDCDNLIDFNKLNSWNKIIKIILFVSLFTRIWMNKCKKKVKSEFVESLSKNGKHTGVDFKKVEIFLLKVVQKGLDKNSLNKNVQIILDKNGILRLNTRIGKSEMPEGFKNPILLPKGHSAVKLIIEKIHVELLHSGVDAVLGNFLIKYWSPGARREAKKVVKNCKKCQKINGPKFALPLMPGLPKERLRKSRAFEAIGVDYLGPSLYKIENGKAKFWIALFTCLSTRAVHLEIALELSALEFMHCLRRFIAIRGCPKKIISDNATQFKVGSELVGAKFVGKWIEKSKNEEKRINNFLINKGIEWCFIPSLSPWAGGVYERLVKLVKDSFKRTLGGVILNLEELRTFIKEVEFSINCRPITFVLWRD